MELFASMREQSNRVGQPGGPGRTQSSAAALTSLCAGISPSSSHFFEVFYIGKIKVTHKKVPDTFIDDALDKFHNHELMKERRNALLATKEEDQSQTSEDKLSPGKVRERAASETGQSDTVAPAMTQVIITPSSERQPGFGSAEIIKPENNSESQNQLEPMRSRSGSAGSALAKKPEQIRRYRNSKNEDNRTMVFQVGHTDLRLISPDRKQILLHKYLKDVTCCTQGTKHGAHFGFICKESNPDTYIGYIFKCQSESFADDVVGAITQAYMTATDAAKKEKQPVISCDHCPMVWYHKLCAEIESLSDKRVQAAIFRRLELLPDEEQDVVLTKLRGAETISGASLKDQNELLMMLLRAHCESKQSRHVHDTAENRHEFLNQYLGGSTIFMKAKRSLTSSFDQLLKRKGSRDDLGPMVKELSLPMNAALCKEGGITTPTSSPTSNTLEVPQTTPQRPRNNSTIGTVSQIPDTSAEDDQQKSSPMMNIFLKVGNSPKSADEEGETGVHAASWRQAIFNNVVTPNKNLNQDVKEGLAGLSKKDKAELRSLWRKAINQQVLLIRMEKENARLKARQEEATVKRIKLEYDDIGASATQNMVVWDMIINKEARKVDSQILTQAIRQGVPRSKRGEIWLFLAERHCARIPPFDTTKCPNYNVPYEDLLKQLTSQQHAILIDLGRTFPTHAYFSSPLGPGQLALFNLLKAYSLLDPEVGYCQGLSFVAGVLLLHMSEEQAFFMLRHVMFRRNLRLQYLPDMAALQVQLYQLSRLLHDNIPDLHAHLDKYEVSPTLYAAPWLLTIFASQFPLGFVTKVFDLLFLEGTEVLFRVALALMGHHKEGLLKCDSFEQVMDYVKATLPIIDKKTMDKIMKEVFTTDISKHLLEYGVEYHVLQEEMSTPRPEVKKLKQMEITNKALTAENRALKEQLEIATSNINRLETSRTSNMMSINRLESQVRSLEVTVSTLGGFISSLAYNNTDLEIPGEILRIVTQINNQERRKSVSANVFRSDTALASRGIPLKVIDDNNQSVDQVKKKVPPPLKSAVSSPNFPAKGSSFFANSHNQIRQQRLGILPNDQKNNITNQLKPMPNGMTKSLSDSRDLRLFMTREESCDLYDGKQETSDVRLGRVLTEADKRSLRLMDGDSESYGKSNSMPASDSKRKLLKASQSSYELGKSESVSAVTEIPIHPLDSDGVNISFGGTTKLRQIRPLKTRNGSCSNITSPSSSTSSLVNTEDRLNSIFSTNKNVELQIIESQDAVKSKAKFDKFNVDSENVGNLCIKNNTNKDAEKSIRETDLLIKTQVPAKQSSLLT